MSLWIERAARKAQERTLVERTRELFDIATAGADPCEYLIVLGRDGGLFMTSKGGWSLDRFLIEHDGRAAWRVRRDRRGVEVVGVAGAARSRLEQGAAHFSPDPPRAGTVRLLRAAWD